MLSWIPFINRFNIWNIILITLWKFAVGENVKSFACSTGVHINYLVTAWRLLPREIHVIIIIMYNGESYSNALQEINYFMFWYTSNACKILC